MIIEVLIIEIIIIGKMWFFVSDYWGGGSGLWLLEVLIIGNIKGLIFIGSHKRSVNVGRQRTVN